MSTRDEMAELWFQLLPRTARDRAALDLAVAAQTAKDVIADSEWRLQDNPTNVTALVNLGRARLVTGDRVGALRDLTKAVATDPASDEGHYYLGVIHRLEGRPGPAQAEFQRTISLNPTHGRAQGNLGILTLQAGQPAEAAPHFLAALQADPADNLARTSLAQIRLDQGRLAEAIALMEEAVRLDPQNAEMAQQLQRLQALKGRERQIKR